MEEAAKSLDFIVAAQLRDEITVLKEQLQKHFGFDRFKGEQELVIQSVLEGNDTFVLMPTGGGKSLCYQLPALLLDGTAIVISPLSPKSE